MGTIDTYLPESLLHWLGAEYPDCSIDEAIGNCIELFFKHRVQVPRGTKRHRRHRPGGKNIKVHFDDDELYERFKRSENSSGSIREIVKWCKARESQARAVPTGEDEKEADRQPMTYYYCPSCGCDLRPKRCPECSGEILGDWLFCAHCSSPLFEDDKEAKAAKEAKPAPRAKAKKGKTKHVVVSFPTAKWEAVKSAYSKPDLAASIRAWLEELGEELSNTEVDLVPRRALAKGASFEKLRMRIPVQSYEKLKETGNVAGALRAIVYRKLGIPITSEKGEKK